MFGLTEFEKKLGLKGIFIFNLILIPIVILFYGKWQSTDERIEALENDESLRVIEEKISKNRDDMLALKIEIHSLKDKLEKNLWEGRKAVNYAKYQKRMGSEDYQYTQRNIIELAKEGAKITKIFEDAKAKNQPKIDSLEQEISNLLKDKQVIEKRISMEIAKIENGKEHWGLGTAFSGILLYFFCPPFRWIANVLLCFWAVGAIFKIFED